MKSSKQRVTRTSSPALRCQVEPYSGQENARPSGTDLARLQSVTLHAAPRRDYARGEMALKKFSEVAKDGCCPKCGYAIMKRGVNAVTGNLAVGLAAGLATGGLLGPARKTIKCGGCGTKYLQG